MNAWVEKKLLRLFERILTRLALTPVEQARYMSPSKTFTEWVEDRGVAGE